jgi:hypothetical protein
MVPLGRSLIRSVVLALSPLSSTSVFRSLPHPQSIRHNLLTLLQFLFQFAVH